MKKKFCNLIVFSLFLTFFLCMDVSALTACRYDHEGEVVYLADVDDNGIFERVVSDLKLSFSDIDIFQFNREGKCPYISISSNNIVYSSKNSCENQKKKDSITCSLEKIGQKLYKENDTNTENNGSNNDNTTGSNDNENNGPFQAVLTEKTATSCTYKSQTQYYNGFLKEDISFTFFINAENNRPYNPDMTCQTSRIGHCSLSADKSYFYGNNANTGGNLICPQYVYYTFKPLQGNVSCEINGYGTDSDANSSGVDSSVGGDTIKPVAPPIETKPLECNGIFQGAFGNFLYEAWKLIKFAVPVLIIALAIADFVKALTSHDEAEVKKAANKLVKRLIIGALLFVLPTIVEFLLRAAGIPFGTCDIK